MPPNQPERPVESCSRVPWGRPRQFLEETSGRDDRAGSLCRKGFSEGSGAGFG